MLLIGWPPPTRGRRFPWPAENRSVSVAGIAGGSELWQAIRTLHSSDTLLPPDEAHPLLLQKVRAMPSDVKAEPPAFLVNGAAGPASLEKGPRWDPLSRVT